MASTSDLYRGMIIMHNNEPHVLIEKEFYSPGKGSAFNRCKLKGIKSGKIINIVLKSGERVEEIEVSTTSMQYLYADDSKAYFMNPETFDQIEISLDIIPGGTNYLHADAKYIMSFYNDEVIFVQLPAKIALIITEAPDAVKGDTATNAMKEAIMETGLKVKVPLFIKTGDKISINTETNEYYSKVN